MVHTSDCAINNGPALPPGPCDCGDSDCPGAAAKVGEHVTTPTWLYLDMIVSEMRKHAGDEDKILALANRVQEVSNAQRR